MGEGLIARRQARSTLCVTLKCVEMKASACCSEYECLILDETVCSHDIAVSCVSLFLWLIVLCATPLPLLSLYELVGVTSDIFTVAND